MTDILLVRHGQTDWNLEGRLQGHSDIALNEQGLAQARRFAEKIAGGHFDAVYCSDLRRAQQTAALIANRLSIPIHVDARLREVNHGDWEGMLISEVLSRFGEAYTAFRNDRPGACPPGGETCSQAAERIVAAVNAAAVQYPGGHIIMVSHGLALAILRCKLNGVPLGQSAKFKLDNLAGEKIHWDAPMG